MCNFYLKYRLGRHLLHLLGCSSNFNDDLLSPCSYFLFGIYQSGFGTQNHYLHHQNQDLN